MPARRKTESFALTFLAGSTAGVVEAALTYPAELIKTQSQLTHLTSPGARMPNVLQLTRTALAHGYAGLYVGLPAVLAGAVGKAGVRFSAYEGFKRSLGDGAGKVSGPKSMLAGLGAGMVEAVLVVTPSETLKTKLIDDARRPTPRFTRGAFQGAATIVREEGLGGIYRGLFPTIMRQGFNSGIRFWSYTGLKSLVSARPGERLPNGVTFGIGALSGIAAVVATQPFDVVKTRMQSLNAKLEYRNSFHCSARIFSAESFFTFWRGTTPRLARSMFSTAIIFTVYEQVIALTGARGPNVA